MRRVFAIVILLCIAYFLGGWIGINIGWISEASYFAYAGIVGGLASVAGLFALTRPGITKSDVQAIEIDTLKSMTETTEQLKTLELARARAKGELGDLELKKKEMELLVKKASLALFLREQYSHHEQQVLEEVARSPQLRESLGKATEASEKLAALNEEIEANPNVRQLKEIIASAGRREPTLAELIDALPFPMKPIFTLLQAINRALTNLFVSIK